MLTDSSLDSTLPQRYSKEEVLGGSDVRNDSAIWAEREVQVFVKGVRL